MANNTNPVVVQPYCCYSWSDLPQEVLELIMSHVTTTFDLLRCRGVCHSWRSAALRVLSCDNGVPKSTTTPLLLLYSDKALCNDDCKLLVVGKNTTTEYRYRAPNMKRLSYKDNVVFNVEFNISSEFGKTMQRYLMADDDGIKEEVVDSGSRGAVPKRTRCIAPYRGWLLLYPFYESALYLFNPLSRMVVQLSPPPKSTMISRPNQLRFITSSSNILTDPTCMVYLYTPYTREIAVYRLGDKKWTPVFNSNYAWVCVIFYKGSFYSVDELGVLRRSLIDKYYSNHKEEDVCNGTSTINRSRYLVESWSGELLMVVMKLEYYQDFSAKWSTGTKLFEIFKFNWSNGEWEEVTNFNDQALFLAHNDSKFVSVRYNPEYKPNSIYFIDDTNSGNEDFGVYDLANRKVETLNLSPGDMQYPYYQYPYYGWFQPVL